MRYLFIIIILFSLLSGCSTTSKYDLYQGEYLELTLKDQTYYFSNHEIPQGEESKLLNLLKAYNTKKFLLHDFTMGDIMKFGSSVQENSFKFYFIDKNNEIKQIIFA